jgi:hypothetical protein
MPSPEGSDTAGGYDYPPPVDADHALLVGALVGAIMNAHEEGFLYDARVLDDEHGNHLATFEIMAPSGRYLVHVVKVPGEEVEP